MLDTSVCVLLMNRGSPRAADRLSRCHPADVCMSVVTYAELLFGVENSEQRAVNMQKVIMFRSRVAVLPLDEPAAAQFGTIRAALTRKGTRMGPFDTLIAGHALARGFTLVTDNVREFRRVKALRIENWTRAG